VLGAAVSDNAATSATVAASPRPVFRAIAMQFIAVLRSFGGAEPCGPAPADIRITDRCSGNSR
jgi:hypothetical protein